MSSSYLGNPVSVYEYNNVWLGGCSVLSREMSDYKFCYKCMMKKECVCFDKVCYKLAAGLNNISDLWNDIRVWPFFWWIKFVFVIVFYTCSYRCSLWLCRLYFLPAHGKQIIYILLLLSSVESYSYFTSKSYLPFYLWLLWSLIS